MTTRKALDPTLVLSLGAGVQSSTMALMATKGVYDIPKPDFAVFADTQAEPQSVYDHLDWLEGELDFEVVRSSYGNLKENVMNATDFVEIPAFADKGGGNPLSLTQRQCTAHYKILVIERVVRERVLANTGRRQLNKNTPVIRMIGISTDEAHRMKDDKHGAFTNTYPLIDSGLSRTDCLLWFKAHYPDRTLPRSACTFCPFHSNDEWANLLRNEPDAFNEAVEVDEAIRYRSAAAIYPYYLHRSGKPLVELKEMFLSIKPDESGQLSLRNDNFGEECEGMCGV